MILLEGADSRKLLQGLTTNDLARLDESAAAPLYTAFLGAQGRVLFDAFVMSGPSGSVLIDVESSACAKLLSHLKRYRLRSKAKARDVSAEYKVLAAVDNAGGGLAGGAIAAHAGQAARKCIASQGDPWVDPRLPFLGSRAVRRRDAPDPDWLDGSHEVGSELYDLQNALLGVPSGARDLRPEEALPLESNMSLLNAISFSKGCYLGQELTARTHFRGAVRKRLVPVVDSRHLQVEESKLGASEEGGRAASMPAYSHLPEQERLLAARVMHSQAMHPPVHEVRTEAVQEDSDSDISTCFAVAEGPLRQTASAKPVANLRSYSEGLGLGIALCRLGALQGGHALVSEEGLALIALQPSWWPDSTLGE